MKIQIGNPVSGGNFFDRESLVKRAWELIESGAHVLIAALRRIGKTSLLYYLRDHPRENYTVIYIITQSINNENEFFRRIVNKVLQTDYVQKSKKALAFLKKHQPTIKKLGPGGVEFGVKEEHDYFDMLIRILQPCQSDVKKFVIMIDEFPETLENILNDEGERAGRHFLQSNRELRHDDKINQNVRFIYTGSIGLETMVSRLNKIDSINDLARLKVLPYTPAEAKRLIHLLLQNVKFELSAQLIDEILKRIEWLIPFYIQLIIDELRNLHRDQDFDRISMEILDQAFDEMLEQRQHFEAWYTRLRTSLKGNQYNFAKELLNVTSENETVTSNEIVNLAVKYQVEDAYKDLLASLVFDGYINNDEHPTSYRYNSPVLRIWWRQNVAN